MYRNILVPVAFDHEERGITALGVAHQLKDDRGRITLLYVEDELPEFIEKHIPTGVAEARRKDMQAKLGTMASTISDDVDTQIASGHAGRTIVEYAIDHGVDCIVIASHKPGLQDYFLGSTAARVVRHSPCSVHVIR